MLFLLPKCPNRSTSANVTLVCDFLLFSCHSFEFSLKVVYDFNGS